MFFGTCLFGFLLHPHEEAENHAVISRRAESHHVDVGGKLLHDYGEYFDDLDKETLIGYLESLLFFFKFLEDDPPEFLLPLIVDLPGIAVIYVGEESLNELPDQLWLEQVVEHLLVVLTLQCARHERKLEHHVLLFVVAAACQNLVEGRLHNLDLAFFVGLVGNPVGAEVD